MSSLPSSPQPPRPARPSSPFGLPFPTMMSSPSSSVSSVVSTPSPSPRRPSTPLRPLAPSPATLEFPLLPELGLKIPVRSPTPRSQKVSLWIDRLPRRAPHDVEREVRRVFEGGARTLGGRTRSLGRMDDLFAVEARRGKGCEIGRSGRASAAKKDSGGLAWWALSMTPTAAGAHSPSPAPGLPRSQTTSVHPSLSSSAPERPSIDGSTFYKRSSMCSSTSTLTPSSVSNSSPSTPSLVYSSCNSSTSSHVSLAFEDARTSHSSTPTPPISPAAPVYTAPIARGHRALGQPHPSSTLKRRSTTGDLLSRYLIADQGAAEIAEPKPASPKVVDEAKPARGGGPTTKKKTLPWRLGMWRRA